MRSLSNTPCGMGWTASSTSSHLQVSSNKLLPFFREAMRVSEQDELDYIVEHHSAFDEDRIGEREAREKLRLAMENWDAPIVVTTAVQFFESLFANRPSQCRKLHNIANSVVILDEAQTLPLKLLRPCVSALDELARNWRSSIVLCTATQPALNTQHGFPGGLEGVREIAPNPKRLYQTLKRTRILHQGILADTQLKECLLRAQQALCIVNTRRHARELFETIPRCSGFASPFHRHVRPASARSAPHGPRTSKRKPARPLGRDVADRKPVSMSISLSSIAPRPVWSPSSKPLDAAIAKDDPNSARCLYSNQLRHRGASRDRK